MKIYTVPPKPAEFIVQFAVTDHPHILEPGPKEAQFFLTQSVKKWQAINEIKLFLTIENNTATLTFLTMEDAELFYEEWNR
jgi:hypothetical protein